MIVALSFSTHRSENTVMNNVRFASYTKEYEDELYKHYEIEKPNIRD